MMAEFEAARILMDLNQSPSPLPTLACTDKVPDLKSFQEKQTIAQSKTTIICFGTGQVIRISTHRKKVPIYQLKKHYYINQAYRARLETVSSIYELQCFHALHTRTLARLHGMIEEGLKRSRDIRKEWRKPLPRFLARKTTPKPIREISNRWEGGSEPVKWNGRFKYLGRKGGKKLEKAGTKSREIRAWIVEVKELIEECEARIGEADKNWVIETRRKRPPPTKQERWMEGRRGWTGLTPEDIEPR